MKQDLRKIIKSDEFSDEKLHTSAYRQEFFEKLNSEKKHNPKKKSYKYFRNIAAVLLIFLSVGYFVISQNNENKNSLSTQIEDMEKEYLRNIDKEWKSFLLLTKDDNLVNKYKKRLADLNEEYLEISEHHKEDNNNILIVEAIIENLQTRLELLKDIQEHITILNTQNNLL